MTKFPSKSSVAMREATWNKINNQKIEMWELIEGQTLTKA